MGEGEKEGEKDGAMRERGKTGVGREERGGKGGRKEAVRRERREQRKEERKEGMGRGRLAE